MSFFLDTSRFASVDSQSVDEAKKVLPSDVVEENSSTKANDAKDADTKILNDVTDVSDGVRRAFRGYDVIIFESTKGYDAAAKDAEDAVVEKNSSTKANDDDDADAEEVTEVSIIGTVLPYTGVENGEIVTINSDDVSPQQRWTIKSECGPKAININDLIGEKGEVEFKKTCDDGKRFNYVVDMMTHVLKDFLAKNDCEFGETFSFDLKDYGIGGRDDDRYGSSQLVHFLNREQFLDDLIEMLEFNLNDEFYSSGKGSLWHVSIEGNILVVESIEPTDRDFLMVDGVNEIEDSDAMRALPSLSILDKASKRGVSFEIVERA